MPQSKKRTIKLTVQLPESLHRTVETLAQEEGYSVDQFLASAAAEKIAAFRALDFLKREAAAGSQQDFERFLSAVARRSLIDSDRIE